MGALLCVIKEFFVFSPPPPQALFAPQFTWAVCEFSLPVLVLALLWQLFSRSDRIFKGKSLLPLLAFLCSSLVVREAFATGEENSFFMLFLHPALSLCSLLLFCSCVMLCQEHFRKKHIAFCVLLLCAAVLSLLASPALMALWRLKIAEGIYAYLCVAFMIICVVCAVAFFAQHKSTDETVFDARMSQKPQEQKPKDVPAEASPWGWDLRAQKMPDVASKVSADKADGRKGGSPQKTTAAKRGRAGSGAPQAKRGGRRAKRGKNTAKRRRKR